jgi:hypothetical protein
VRCPRCESAFDEAAVCCPACGAPLRLPDEPTPVALSVTLDLDRRRSRTPIPASAPPPPVAGEEEGDLGDLSFDPPSDDGPWTMAARPPVDDEPEPGPVAAEMDALDDGAEDEPIAASSSPALALDRGLELGDERGPDALRAGGAALELDSGGEGDGDDAAEDGDPDGEDSGEYSAADGEDADDESDDDDGLDDDGELAADGMDPVALQRGRVLSLASVAFAGAAVLVAVLSWR